MFMAPHDGLVVDGSPQQVGRGPPFRPPQDTYRAAEYCSVHLFSFCYSSTKILLPRHRGHEFDFVSFSRSLCLIQLHMLHHPAMWSMEWGLSLAVGSPSLAISILILTKACL
ncbi:hypothetical protein P691DRAFT_501164 [Macrolepiota fuliginosa MF-IS2]|uniref:Uncharacterized protein n=1 Tax=Macrolepiota fuliginosa MF-IS2 TaxID=1400762 RepID=A0A9P6BY88_9AGAR|nr:hypothetical protein P691DRAFT_501164 [Macrolepiota fuliginosa MF-IS2]